MRGALPAFVGIWALGIFCADRAAGIVDAASLRAACAALAVAALVASAVAAGRVRLVCTGCVAGALGAHAMAGRLEEATWALPDGRLDAVVEATVGRVALVGPALGIDLEAMVGAESGVRLPPRARLFVRLPAEEFDALVPGDRVRAHLRFRRVVGRSNPGSADPADRLRRAGVAMLATPVHPRLQVLIDEGGRLHGLRRSFHQRRRAAASRLRDARAALAAALALGDRSGLSDADQEALRTLGLSHLLAVSGLHVALVGGLGFAVARRVLLRVRPWADPRRVALVAAWSGAVLYGLLAGWGVPVRRALVFGVGLATGFALRRPVSRGAPLALAAWAVLAAEPGALFDPGAQLSFAASAALLFARRSGDVRPSGRLRGLWEGLGVSAVALAATAPLAAWHFGRTAPVALLTNLVAVPLTAVVLLPGSLVVAAVAGFPGDQCAASRLLEAFGVGSEWLLGGLGELASRVPLEASRSRASSVGIVCSAACALLVVRAGSLRGRVAWVLAGSVALAVLPPVAFDPAPPRVVALDVGQGDAAFVQGREATVLVDAGGPGRGRIVVLPALRAAGVRRVDLAVLTHADLDHRGGLQEVLAGIPVGRLWLPRGAASDPALAPLLRAASAADVTVEERGAGDPPLRVGALEVVPLWPASCGAEPGRGACSSGSRRNDRSLVVRVDVAGARVLFPGDVQRAGERALLDSGADVRADVLMVPHHGSRTSSSVPFLRGVAPEIALASAPCLGRFEMPALEVVGRLRDRGAALHWTGRSGALVVGLGPVREVRAWRRSPLEFCR